MIDVNAEACEACSWPAPLSAVNCGNCGASLGTGVDERTILRPHPHATVDTRPGSEVANENIPPVRVVLPPVTPDTGGHSNFGQLLDPAIQEAAAEVDRPGRRPVRRAVVAVGVATVVAVVGTFATVAVVTAPSTGPASRAPTTLSAPAVVMLPGWASSPTWSHTEVTSAAIATDGRRLLVASPSRIEVLDAVSGKTIASEPAPAETVTTAAVLVGGEPALAALTPSMVLIWTNDTETPLAVDVSGQVSVILRGGTLFTHSADGSFTVITAAGSTPILSPRAGTIPLGAAGESILWGSSRGTVLLAAMNGALLAEVALTAPAAGASVTSWVFTSDRATGNGFPTRSVATESTVMVTWSLADGSRQVIIHSTTDGSALFTAADQLAPLLVSADSTTVITTTQRVTVATGDATDLPAGFVPTLQLGDDVYGSDLDGALQVVRAGTALPVSPSPTVTPIGVTVSNSLVTFTGTTLACFQATPTSHRADGSHPSTPLNTKEKNT